MTLKCVRICSKWLKLTKYTQVRIVGNSKLFCTKLSAIQALGKQNFLRWGSLQFAKQLFASVKQRKAFTNQWQQMTSTKHVHQIWTKSDAISTVSWKMNNLCHWLVLLICWRGHHLPLISGGKHDQKGWAICTKYQRIIWTWWIHVLQNLKDSAECKFLPSKKSKVFCI